MKNLKSKLLNVWNLVSFITSLYITLQIGQMALMSSFPLPQVAFGAATVVLAINTLITGYKAFSK